MRLIAFNNGYCSAKKNYINKKAKKEKINFPATFYYLEINDKKILLDTGYSSKLLSSSNLIVNLYSKLTKVNCSKDADIILQENNICAKDIQYIILSHFHPDHYGSLAKFPNAKIICSEKEREILTKNDFSKVRNLLFSEFLPKNLDSRIISMEAFRKEELFNLKEKIEFFNILDLDEIYSFYITGHTKGHIGIYLKSLRKLMIFDAVWCMENLEGAEPRTILKKLSLYNEKEYKDSIKKINILLNHLNEIEQKKVELIILHDEKYMRSPYEF